jgi:hypothetical protein
MTLSTLQNRFSFAGNGVTQIFPFNAKFIKDTDLKIIEVDDVTKAETPKTITTHYTVSGGNNATGSITMLTAPLANKTLVIYRDTSADQDLDLIENDRLPVEEIEKRFDKTTQLAQRLKEKVLRAIGLREGFTGTFDLTLPIGMDDVANAGKSIVVNTAATGLEFGLSAAGIAAAQAAAAASAAAAAISAASAAASALAAAAAAATANNVTAVDVSGGNVPEILPSALLNPNMIITYLNISFASMNRIDVSTTGGDTIMGQATDEIYAGEVRRYWSDGISTWFLI